MGSRDEKRKRETTVEVQSLRKRKLAEKNALATFKRVPAMHCAVNTLHDPFLPELQRKIYLNSRILFGM